MICFSCYTCWLVFLITSSIVHSPHWRHYNILLQGYYSCLPPCVWCACTGCHMVWYLNTLCPSFLTSFFAAFSCLHLMTGEAVDALITAQGWLKQADGTVFVGRKEAATTKPKKVVEQLDLDSKCLDILLVAVRSLSLCIVST